MHDYLQRYITIHRHEVKPLLLSALFFFCVLTPLQLLRPVRDALGMTRGMDDIRWLFVATAVVTLMVNPAFSWLVSLFRRITFITICYGFFALSLVGFYVLLTLAPEQIGERSGQVFYVWFSVFNLFCTMIFWALMVDCYSLDQSKRLFGTIAVGGTLGAIYGPTLTAFLAKPLGTPALLLVAAFFLLLAIAAAWGVVGSRRQLAGNSDNDRATGNVHSVIGGGAWDGIKAVFQSKYLLMAAGYMLMLSVISTLIYFTRMQMVSAATDITDERTQLLARMDASVQTATLVLQLLVAGPLMKRFGVSTALVLLPALMAGGFIGLALVGSVVAVVALETVFKAVQRAIMRPARETLFTVVSPEEKYKAKAFTDTFVYRIGDVTGAWTDGALKGLGFGLAGLATLTVPLAAIWGLIGLWLGRQQLVLAAEQAAEVDAETLTQDTASSTAERTE